MKNSLKQPTNIKKDNQFIKLQKKIDELEKRIRTLEMKNTPLGQYPPEPKNKFWWGAKDKDKTIE